MPGLHHFVPAFILKRFIPETLGGLGLPQRAVDAERVLKAKPGVDQRKLKVVAWEHRDRRLAARRVRETFSVPGLYGVPVAHDSVRLGMIAFFAKLMAEEEIPRKFDHLSEEFFKDLALEVDGPFRELVERGHTSRADRRGAKLCSMVEAGKELSSDEYLDLERFLAFSRNRTPAFRDSHFEKVEARSARTIRALMGAMKDALVEEGHQGAAGFDPDEFAAAVRPSLFAISAVQAAITQMGYLSKNGIGIAAMHAEGDARFMLPDNPLRPFDVSALRRRPGVGVPGMKFEHVVGLLPISPTCAIAVSRSIPVGRVEHVGVGDAVVRKHNAGMYLHSVDAVVVPWPNVDLPRKFPLGSRRRRARG